MKEQFYCILDIGGTKILTLLINNNRKVLYREKVPTRVTGGKDALIDQINQTVERASMQLTPGNKINGVGICIAAFVNYKEGVIYGAPNLPFNEIIPLKKVISDKWKIPVVIENDANAAVLGEVFYGSAKGLSNVIYITVSTGIGGGLFLDGRLHRGSEGVTGEIGHFKLTGIDNLCGCGKKGCLESIASGEAIARLGRKNVSGDLHTTAFIFKEAEKGNREAGKIVGDAIKSLGLSLANLIALLNPECIVIGGGVSKEGKPFFEKLQNQIDEHLSVPGMQKVRLAKAKLDPESGVWGIFSLF